MSLEDEEQTGAWYRDGLRFECTMCGRCCMGGPGVVWVTWQDLREISALRRISEYAFKREYLIGVDDSFIMRSRLNLDCIMLDQRTGQCKIYDVRPQQCRAYPWWPDLLESPEAWNAEEARCPGINKGPIWAYSEIKRRMLR